VLLRSHIFVDATATSGLLGAIAAGLISVTLRADARAGVAHRRTSAFDGPVIVEVHGQP
jgi:hypothetical protein